MRTLSRLLRDQRGAALAEYGLLVAGITLVALVAVSVLGSKVGGLIGAVATMLPGAHAQQNAPVVVSELVELETVDLNGDGVLEQRLDQRLIDKNQGTHRLGASLGLDEHGASHLYQLNADKNPFHGGGGSQ
jgi:Flp pilus assembly pilin Flp